MAAGICYQCGGELLAADGSYSEILVDNGIHGVAACAICNNCKRERRSNA